MLTFKRELLAKKWKILFNMQKNNASGFDDFHHIFFGSRWNFIFFSHWFF